MKKLILTTLTLTMLSTGAFAAGNETPGVDQRQENQAKRIEEGKATGQLTEREAERMERQQARTEKLEEKAKADGEVTKKERAALHHRQNKTSKKIHRQKHDHQHN